MATNPHTNLDTFTNDHNFTGGANEATTPGNAHTPTSSGDYLITYSILDNESLINTYYDGTIVPQKWITNYVPAGSTSFNQKIDDAFVDILSANEANDAFGVLFQHVAKLEFQETDIFIGTIAIGQATDTAFPGTPSNQGAVTLFTDITETDANAQAANSDIWVNTEHAQWNIDTSNGQSSIIEGTWSYKVVLEELSHSLGVDIYSFFDAQGNSIGGNSNGLLVGSSDYLNNQKYSVTSYKLHSDLYHNPSAHYVEELGLYDVFALQQIYGSNTETRNGTTTYTFGSNQAFGATAAVPFSYTIWDGGGRDLISADGYDDGVEIDLRQGRFSSIGKKGDPGNTAVEWDANYSGSAPNPDPGNVAIAFGAIIEDAEGTNKRDVIIGNAWDNVLYGGGGDDDLYGDGVVSPDMDVGYGANSGEYDPQHPDGAPATDGSGDDTLYGGAGVDNLYGGAGDDIFYSDEGSSFNVGLDYDVYANILDGGAGFDVANYDYRADDEAIYDFIASTTVSDKSNGIYEIEKTYNFGTPVIDNLSGIERIALAEQRANTTTRYNQQEAVVTGLDNSQYVVVWKSQSQASQSYALVYQRFDINGEKIGSEEVITNKYITGSNNSQPQVVDTGGGSFAVVWTGRTTSAQSDAYATNRWKTFVSKIEANDSVNSNIDAKMVFADPGNDPSDNLKRTQEYQPDVTVLNNGNLAISAEGYGDGLNGADIITQIIDISSGDRIGANEDVAVNTTTSLNQLSSEVSALSNGGYVITWTGQDADQSGLFGRIYNASGAPTGSQFQINISIFDNQVGQKVTSVPDGSFIVSWASEHSGNYDVYIRHFNSDGTARSDEILVNEHTSGSQLRPDIDMLDDSRFVVVFQQDDASVESQGSSVWGQQFDIDSQTGDIFAQGQNFQINVTEEAAQTNPEVGVTTDGDFAVAFVSSQLGISPDREDIGLRTYLTSDSVV